MTVQTTDRLRLVAGTKVLAAAEMEDRVEFAGLSGALVPETWPPDNLRDVLGYFYGLYEEHPEWEGWLTWYAIRIDNDYGDPSKGVAYNEAADHCSWEAMKGFLAEIFGAK